MKLPVVSVIVPTQDRCDVLEQTLVLLAAQEWPPDRLEVLVCDGSTDGTEAMVARRAGASAMSIRLVTVGASLPAVKRNEGLRRARGEYVIFLDDDVWVRPDFIRRHVEMHQRWATPVAVLGLVEQSPRMSGDAFLEWFQPFGYERIADRAGQAVPFWFHWSMNLSFPRQIMIDHDLFFHEGWAEPGHDDVELGYRWVGAGFQTVYHPDAWGEHYHPLDLAGACDLQASLGRGLRELEALVGAPDLLERYGIFSWRSSPRSLVRGLARRAIFNRWTVAPLIARLHTPRRRRRWIEWSYWKLMVHHTEAAYRSTPPRRTAAPQPSFLPIHLVEVVPPDRDGIVIDLRDQVLDLTALDTVFA